MAIGLPSPLRVSKKDREEHNLTHTPYRSWCKICVKMRGTNKQHRKQNKSDKDEENAKVRRICMDYFFMSQEDEKAGENPILVAVDEGTGDKYARAAGSKGVGEEGEDHWLVKDLSAERKSWGHTGGEKSRIILKSDNEKSIVASKPTRGRFHGGIVIPEHPAKGESQSNGVVEGAGRIVRDFVRVLKGQIEENTGGHIETDDVIIQWIVRWAAMLCSRYLVGKDGLTAIERRRGRKCKVPVVPMGESVFYKEIRSKKERSQKLQSEVKEGVWLGHARNTNEVLIGTKEGVIRAYTVWRKEEGERWNLEAIKGMKGTPKQPDPSRGGIEIPIRVRFDDPNDEDPIPSVQPKRGPDLRRMRITDEILKKYGYTEGCDGCRFKRTGLGDHRAHTERCTDAVIFSNGSRTRLATVTGQLSEKVNFQIGDH